MKITFEEAIHMVGPHIDECPEEGRDKIAASINHAEYTAWSKGDWWGLKRPVLLKNYEGYIALPYGWGTLLALNLHGVPTKINSEWYEFHPNGPGSLEECSDPCDFKTNQIMDMVEYATFRDICKGEKVGVRSKQCENGKAHVVIGGLDSDGNRVYTYEQKDDDCQDTIHGEKIFLKENKIVLSCYQWDRKGIEDIIKTPTLGAVEFYSVNEKTNENRLISVMEPNQTTSCIRKYRLPSKFCKYECISAYVKRDAPTPHIHDTEILLISSPEALLDLSLAAYNKYNLGRMEEYAIFLASGIEALNDQLTQKRKNTVMNVNVIGLDFDINREDQNMFT